MPLASFDPVYMDKMKKLVMICPTLVDQGGHECDYTAMIASAALQCIGDVVTIIPSDAGPMPSIPGHTEPALPSYHYSNAVCRRIIQTLKRAFCYGQLFLRHGKPDTIWFVHSAPHNELALLAAAWLLLPRRNQRLILFLRHGIPIFKPLPMACLAFAGRCGVAFVTDSDGIAGHMSEKLRCPVVEVPIPIRLSRAPRARGKPIVCGYFGARRRSKGFHRLPALIEALSAIEPSARFIIQAYRHRDDKPGDPLIELQAERLKTMPDVRLIEQTLDSEDFANELAACSLILLPYAVDVYREATSGVFVMAVAAGAVVVTTEGTWMARQAKKFGLGKVVLTPHDPTARQLAKAMREAISLARDPLPPGEKECQWCANQSSDNVLKKLMAIAKLD